MTDTAAAPAAPTTDLGQWRAAKLLGLGLLLPALAMLTIGYVLPTIWTISASLDGGTDHYRRLGELDYPARFGFAGSVMIWPILTVTLVALVVAYLANRAGWAARWLVRLALVLPMVALAPTAFAVGWRLDRVDPAGEASQSLVRGAVGFTMFGLLVGVGVTLYLATLRHREQTRPGAATVVAAVLAVLTTLAVGLQLYSYPIVLGDREHTATPLVTVIDLGFLNGETGFAATAATVLLAALAGLGVLAVLLAIASGLRIRISPTRRDDPAEAPRRRPIHAEAFQGTKAAARHSEAVIGSVLALIGVLAVTGYGLWPWLSRLLQFRGDSSASQVLLNTWLPPLIGAAIGMVAAALAGFAIGALRPLGRFSSALLLLFAPWLFVGNGVLSLAEHERLADRGLSDSFWSLVPPGWVVVPAVVVFALLFRGQESRWRELRADGLGLGPATLRALVLPALPMFWLIGAVTWLVQAQSLIWNQVSATDADRAAGPAAVIGQLGGPLTDESSVAIGLVLPFVVIVGFAVGLAVLQVGYLDRLTIRVGRDERS